MGSRKTLPFPVPHISLSGAAAATRGLCDRLAHLLRPLRVLDAVHWPEEIERAFHTSGRTTLPPVTTGTYRHRPLSFAPAQTNAALCDLSRDTRSSLGTTHPAARLLLRSIREARLTVDLITARGTPAFAVRSRELFGSSRAADWLAPLTRLLKSLAETLPPDGSIDHSLSAPDAAIELTARFSRYFGAAASIRVVVSGELAADAAAGNGYLKLRAGARFSSADIRLLEVHEGWAHLGTSLNGLCQPVLPVLARCTPSGTRTQEGLAVFLELVTGTAGRSRVSKLLNRVRAVEMAEDGADFLEVYRHFQAAADDPAESYRKAARVFRGGLPTGTGPFTKDLTYGAGLVRVLEFVRFELAGGGWGRIPLLACGKVAVEDVPALAELGRAGWISPPRWLPPPLRDRDGLLAQLKLLPSTSSSDRIQRQRTAKEVLPRITSSRST